MLFKLLSSSSTFENLLPSSSTSAKASTSGRVIDVRSSHRRPPTLRRA
uniref:Uncharacterized protein n=1 Tax=Cucumis melo TaxID=3656 RepID=A0A9I9EG43_CUCME